MTRKTCPHCGSKRYRALSAPSAYPRQFDCMKCDKMWQVPSEEEIQARRLRRIADAQAEVVSPRGFLGRTWRWLGFRPPLRLRVVNAKEGTYWVARVLCRLGLHDHERVGIFSPKQDDVIDILVCRRKECQLVAGQLVCSGWKADGVTPRAPKLVRINEL